MTKILLSIILVLAVIYIVPFIVYGLSSALFGLQPPAGTSPWMFLLSVFVSKIGTAIALVVDVCYWRSRPSNWAELFLERGNNRSSFGDNIFACFGIYC